jgi:hypothetical protein
MNPTRDDLLNWIRLFEAHGQNRQWIGPDPYEGMNATRFVGPLQKSVAGRRVIAQAVKRSPLNLRPILGIEPVRISSTMAFAISTYVRATFLPEHERERKLQGAIEMLKDLRSPGYEDWCWGYQFPTQSRVFFYDRWAPNIVSTAFATMAIMDAYEQTGDESLLEIAASAARFVLDHVPQTEDAPGAYFGYLVGDRSPIHNSSLHACTILARVGAEIGEPAWLDRAAEGVKWTLSRQRRDGSWPYGERANLSWVDNFHTGYVLDSLRILWDAGVPGIEEPWHRGLEYWRRELFLADGTPKYYSNNIYPIDGQCVSQAIQTLAIASRDVPSCLDDAWRVMGWALQNFRRPDGLLYFQRRRHWTNKVPHLRWVQTPMLLALTHLLVADDAHRHAADRSGAGDRTAVAG